MSDIAEISEAKGFDSFAIKLGDLMRGERATLGKSLLDVQRDLRIKAAYIAAIENCDPSAFQTPGFISGYVRSYARYLGLNPETIFDQFCAESGFDGVHPGISRQPGPKPKPKVISPVHIQVGKNAPKKSEPIVTARTSFSPAGEGIMSQVSVSALGSILVLTVLILGIGYGAWAVLQDIQRVEFEPISPSSQIIAAAPITTGANATVPGTEEAKRTAALDHLYRPVELDVPVMTPRDGPIAALDPDNIGALITSNGSNTARETAEMMAAVSPRVTEIAAPEIAIVATRPAWVRVSLADGSILFERILDGGESFLLPQGGQPTTLRAGNSGAVYVTLDGKAFGPVGQDSSVVKDVTLGPAEILQAYAEVVEPAALQALDSPQVITLNSADQ